MRGAAQRILYLLQLAGLLDQSLGGDGGIEQLKQDQAAIFVVVKRAVGGYVALAAGQVQGLQQWPELFEILEAMERLAVKLLRIGIFAAGCGNLFGRCFHAGIMRERGVDAIATHCYTRKIPLKQKAGRTVLGRESLI